MNIDAFQDLRRIVREELRGLRLPELAVVQDIHPHADDSDDDNHACTVRMRDSGAVLARVPVVAVRKGLAAIPDVGDLVLVQYLGGDANAPLITGTLYNDEDRPPKNAEGEAVLRLPADADEGEGVDLRVNAVAETSLVLRLGSSLTLELKDDDPVVKIDVGDGSATLTIESDGTVRLKSAKALVLEGGEVTIKGSKITAEADGELVLKGAVIKLN